MSRRSGDLIKVVAFLQMRVSAYRSLRWFGAQKTYKSFFIVISMYVRAAVTFARKIKAVLLLLVYAMTELQQSIIVPFRLRTNFLKTKSVTFSSETLFTESSKCQIRF